MGQTVNLLAYAYGGSNPSLPTSFTIEKNVIYDLSFCEENCKSSINKLSMYLRE